MEFYLGEESINRSQNGSWKTHIARNCNLSSSLMHQQQLLWFFLGNSLFGAEGHLEHLQKLELKSSFLIFRAREHLSTSLSECSSCSQAQ